MNIRTLATAFAAAALFGLTAAPARAQTAAPEVAPPPADAQAIGRPDPDLQSALLVIPSCRSKRQSALVVFLSKSYPEKRTAPLGRAK